MAYKGIIHFHSEISYDSQTSIKKIVKFAVENELNFLVLTDHDTVEGSVKLREEVKKQNLNIEVPIAAEYLTEFGDVIACFIKEEINFSSFDDLVKKVKAQDGLILFPHPYAGHKNIEYIAENADLVEVFNARQSTLKDQKAMSLAGKFNKVNYLSPDAHLVSELKNAIVSYEGSRSLKDSLIFEKYSYSSCVKTTPFKIFITQVFKTFENNNLMKAVLKSLIQLAKSVIKQRVSFFRKIS
jgi:predicted metal-dependent phosphoesterase TrpH